MGFLDRMEKSLHKRSPSSSRAAETSSEKLASNNPYKSHGESSEPAGDDLPAYTAGPSNAGPSTAPNSQYGANVHTGPSTAPSDHSQVDGDAPPPYDPWLAVPDSTLLPPPPPLKEEFSPANNASADDAERARTWCYFNPVWGPRTWSGPELSQITHRQFTLSAPPGNPHIKISHMGRQQTSLHCSRRQGDVTVLSNLPLYAAQYPLQPGEQRTIYFEIGIKSLSGSDATVAIGFLAPPYPPNRLPGWHRGSLAVHNDDGRRYVNDDGGGSDFVRPFGQGDRIGLGMSFTGSQYPGQPHAARVFFTRNGVEENSWNLHESMDEGDGGVLGLDGTTDLYAAIGVCSGVDLDVLWTGYG